MDAILLSRKRTAESLGISLRTLDNVVAAGELKPRRVGRRVLFERRELERFARRDHTTRGAGQSSVNGET